MGCGFGCGGLAWWVAGIVWRFRSAGKFASGDSLNEYQMIRVEATRDDPTNYYQLESGKFMYIYYMICFIFFGVSCGCSILGMIVSCLCK